MRRKIVVAFPNVWACELIQRAELQLMEARIIAYFKIEKFEKKFQGI